jgi:hypothetical protein
MKRSLGIALMLVFCSIAAFAAKTTQTLHIPDTVYVGDVKVPQGDYKMSMDGAGASIEVTLVLDGRQVVKAQARMVEAKHDQVNVTISNRDGKEILQTIELKNGTLVLGMPIK